MGFGMHVKQIRTQKGLTLQELADRSRVSRSMLSEIEREEKNPTLQVACQIAEALDMMLSQLLGEHEQRETIVIRRDQRLVYRDEQSGFERHLLSPSFPSRGIEFVLNILPPGKESGNFPSHKPGVKEHIVVAHGKLRVVLGDDMYELGTGDSIYFEANVEHRFVNISGEECHYYLVIAS